MNQRAPNYLISTRSLPTCLLNATRVMTFYSRSLDGVERVLFSMKPAPQLQREYQRCITRSESFITVCERTDVAGFFQHPSHSQRRSIAVLGSYDLQTIRQTVAVPTNRNGG